MRFHLPVERDQLAERRAREELDPVEVQQNTLAVIDLDNAEKLRAEFDDLGLVEDLAVVEPDNGHVADLRHVDPLMRRHADEALAKVQDPGLLDPCQRAPASRPRPGTPGHRNPCQRA